jgi:hypothetical protein
VAHQGPTQSLPVIFYLTIRKQHAVEHWSLACVKMNVADPAVYKYPIRRRENPRTPSSSSPSLSLAIPA